MEVLKDLAGAEDLLLDAELPNKVVQSRGGNDYYITKINADTIPYTGTFGQSGMQSIKAKIDTSLELRNLVSRDTIADLKLENGLVFNTIDVLGYYTKGDGGGGAFYWDSTSTETDNGGTIIQATGISTGRWKRSESKIINVREFGAKGDNINDDAVAINKSVLALTNGTSLYFPSGSYLVSSQIVIAISSLTIYGDGIRSSFIYPHSTFAGDSLLYIGSSTVHSNIIKDITASMAFGALGNDKDAIIIDSFYNFDILNVKAQGGNYITRETAGLRLIRGLHTRIDKCNLHNSYCHGLLVESHNNDLIITGTSFDESDTSIKSLGNINSMLISDCIFGSARPNPIYPALTNARNIDLDIGNHGTVIILNNLFAGGGGTKFHIRWSSITRCEINGNLLANAGRYSIARNGGSQNTIVGTNIFDGNGIDGTTIDPSLGIRDVDATPFTSDIYFRSAYLTPSIISNNTSTVTDKPMAWVEGTTTNPLTTKTTIIGNNTTFGTSAYITQTLVKDSKIFLDGRLTTTTTIPAEVTIPTKTYTAGQSQTGVLSFYGVVSGDLIVSSPKVTGLTAGLILTITVNASNQIRWTITNASTASITEPDRIFVVSAIKL